MLSKERVRLMTRLARYEAREGEKTLKISRYYRSDYIGIALLKNFFATTFAYIVLLVLILLCQIDALLSTLNELNIEPIIMEAIVGYLIMLAVYSGITYAVASVRYAKAKKSVEGYEGALERLEKLYDIEIPEIRPDGAEGVN